MASLIPAGVQWIKAAVGVFEPEKNRVLLEDSRSIYYDQLVVAPGIKPCIFRETTGYARAC